MPKSRRCPRKSYPGRRAMVGLFGPVQSRKRRQPAAPKKPASPKKPAAPKKPASPKKPAAPKKKLEDMSLAQLQKKAQKSGISIYQTRKGAIVKSKAGKPKLAKKTVLIRKIKAKRKGGRYYPYY